MSECVCVRDYSIGGCVISHHRGQSLGRTPPIDDY